LTQVPVQTSGALRGETASFAADILALFTAVDIEDGDGRRIADNIALFAARIGNGRPA